MILRIKKKVNNSMSTLKIIRKIIKEQIIRIEQQHKEDVLTRKLNEGLIKTYPLKQTVASITKFLNERSQIKFDIFENEQNNTFTLVIHSGLTANNLELVLPFINTFGYFPSSYYIERYRMIPLYGKYSFTNLSNILNQINNNYQNISLIFESKYDEDVTDQLPRYIYHLTDIKNKGKIEQLGLVPKNNVKSTHPERIYLLKTLDNADILAKQFGYSKYCIFQIDRNKLNNVKFYNDPNFINKDGFYTYSNIPPDSIKLLKTK